jgi:creatinine amidohydrolase
MERKMNRDEIQWERMLPKEYRSAIGKLPVCFLPLGTVEWHGEHSALGLDSLKAHELCVISAHKAGGGVVHPPLYGGMGSLDMPGTIKMEDDYTWENLLLRPWLEKLCSEIHRNGFQVIIMITGHYGHNQQIVVRETAARMSERLNIPVLGLPEYWLAHDLGYWGDHAGIGETSLLMHLHPELVRIDRIRNDPDYGKTDEIEIGSSSALGERYSEVITDRLSVLAKAMIHWDASKLEAFVKAERAIINIQVKGWRTESPWAAWKHLYNKKIADYGRLLVEEKFEEIEELASNLL